MHRESKSSAHAPPPRGRPRSGGPSPMVADLARRFALFRTEHPKGTRIPQHLRSAVLGALARGAVSGQVERACRISSDQVKAWRARDGGAGTPASEAAIARVFSVVDQPFAPAREAAASTPGEALELRLGPWSVSVRLAERS